MIKGAETAVNGETDRLCRSCGGLFSPGRKNQKDCDDCKGPKARMRAFVGEHVVEAHVPAVMGAAEKQLLQQLDDVDRALAEAQTLDDCQRLNVVTAGLEKMVLEAGLGVRSENRIIRRRIRAKCKGGEMLGPAERGGDRGKSHDVTCLPDGLNKMEAHRWRLMATVPPDEREAYMDECEDHGDRIKQTRLLRMAKELLAADRRDKDRELVAGAIDDLRELEKAPVPTIVIDPPWDWGDEGDVSQLGRAQPAYATMPIEEVAALPIAAITEPNAHIYLWITNRSLPKGFPLLEQWGFRYITCITWVKPSFGMGNYFRGSTEHILFGVKGSLPLARKDMPTHFGTDAKRRKHSEKPDELYEIVESCSPGPRAELFARKPRDGWITWPKEKRE